MERENIVSRSVRRLRKGTAAVSAGVLSVLLVAGCAEGDTSGDTSHDVDVIADGLDAPWSIAFTGEGTPLLTERDSARILELDDAGETREVAVIDEVSAGGEGGLLGLAVDENHLYAYFTTDSDNRVARFGLTGGPGELELGEQETVLEGLPAANVHNGGRIAFGPDGMLYVTTGDAGETARSQDLDSLAGKILRMQPDGSTPQDNPFDDSLVYTYGHRNAQGIDWAEDGTMYASEFGQDTWDELNVIEAGGNYGWPEVEGIGDGDGSGGYTDPVQQWEPADASPSGISVTGDAVYIANLRGQRLIEAPLSDPTTSTDHLVEEYGRLRDVVEAPDGTLWVLTNNTDGRGAPGQDDDRIIRLND